MIPGSGNHLVDLHDFLEMQHKPRTCKFCHEVDCVCDDENEGENQ